MMIVLHAVTRALPDEVDTEGLLARTKGAVTVLHEHTDTPPTPAQEAVIAHGRRISRLAERWAVLPMRYGTTVESVAELDAVMAEQTETWQRRLSVVDGHCELLVHVDVPRRDVAEEPATTGREYLLRRSEELRRHDEVWDAVTDAARPWSRERRVLADGSRMAVLVARDQVDPLRAALDEWAAANPAARMAVTGPWPPFSFCQEPSDA